MSFNSRGNSIWGGWAENRATPHFSRNEKQEASQTTQSFPQEVEPKGIYPEALGTWPCAIKCK